MRRHGTMRYTRATLICWLALITAVYAADNNVGTWKLNLSKSSYSPGPASKSQTTRVEAVENGIKEVVDRINGQGKAIHFEWTAKYDGKDYPVKGDPDRDTVAISKVDDYTTEVISKKDGKTTTISRTVVARDGRSRTVTVTGTNTQGQKVSNSVVFERQ